MFHHTLCVEEEMCKRERGGRGSEGRREGRR
jgi:hypothetical protein